MKVYKNGICREIDQKREQEFREKGYVIEGKETTDIVEVLKQENEALKAENIALKTENEVLKQENGVLKAENIALKAEIEALKQEKEALQTQTGGEENAERTDNEVKQVVATGEGSATSGGNGQTATAEQAKTTARAKK